VFCLWPAPSQSGLLQTTCVDATRLPTTSHAQPRVPAAATHRMQAQSHAPRVYIGRRAHVATTMHAALMLITCAVLSTLAGCHAKCYSYSPAPPSSFHPFEQKLPPSCDCSCSAKSAPEPVLPVVDSTETISMDAVQPVEFTPEEPEPPKPTRYVSRTMPPTSSLRLQG
jgi:hypothetical protein